MKGARNSASGREPVIAIRVASMRRGQDASTSCACKGLPRPPQSPALRPFSVVLEMPRRESRLVQSAEMHVVIGVLDILLLCLLASAQSQEDAVRIRHILVGCPRKGEQVFMLGMHKTHQTRAERGIPLPRAGRGCAPSCPSFPDGLPARHGWRC